MKDPSTNPSSDAPAADNLPLPGGSHRSRAGPLAKLAHELKTPISAIVAAAAVMRDERLGPVGNDKYRGYIRDIHSSAQLVLTVIDRMLAQRSGSGAETRLPRQEIDVLSLVDGVASMMQPLADASGVVLTVADFNVGPAGAPKVLGDQVTLQQVLLNLLSNAIKFNAIGGRVEMAVTVGDDGSVSICVSDTGSGMSADQIEAALAGEVVPADSRTMIGRGLGIGLPLVRSLCEANGARLAISSHESAGTRVSVVFDRDHGYNGEPTTLKS